MQENDSKKHGGKYNSAKKNSNIKNIAMFKRWGLYRGCCFIWSDLRKISEKVIIEEKFREGEKKPSCTNPI